MLVATGSYNESIDFLGKAIVLRVDNRSTGATIDGTGQNDSVVKFISSEGPGSVLDGFSIVGGVGALVEVEPGTFKRVGGGILIDGSSPSLLNCSFEGNNAQRGGGGYVSGGANPTLVNCLFIANSAEHGGGFYITSGATRRSPTASCKATPRRSTGEACSTRPAAAF